MSCRSDGFEFSLASPEDSERILELFEDRDFSGNISVLFTRRPDPYKSLMLEGDKAVIPIVRNIKNGNIYAMGCCIIRKGFINGEIKNIGYLTSLKIAKEAKSILYMIKDVYRFLYEETKDEVDVYYTTILEDNKDAQKLLEKKRKNMPVYNYEGDYKVYCFAKRSYNLRIKNMEGYKFEVGNMKGIKEFYKNNLNKYNFSPIDIDLPGVNDHDFLTMRDKNDNIIAACLLWDQNYHKQYIITKYSGIFKYIHKLPTNFFGYPSFPKENKAVNYASISLFLVRNMDLEIADFFLRNIAAYAKEYDFLMMGLFEDHPLNNIFKNIRHIKYKSRLYRVNWIDEFFELDDKPISIEVGLL